jgi:hypothetical protein
VLTLLVATARSRAADDFWTGPTVAALTAAAIALGVGLWSAFTTRGIAKENRAAARRQLQADLRLRQLNEFYEPLAMLRVKSKHLRESLPDKEQDGSKWRLVRHIAEVKASPGRARIVEEILAINARIEELLINKAGLMEGPAPASFERFMHHSGLLKLAWEHDGELIEDNNNGVVRPEDVPFPTEIDADIDVSRATVRTALDALRT